MTGALVAGLAAAVAVWLGTGWRGGPPTTRQLPRPGSAAGGDWVRSGRRVWPLLAGAGCWVVVSGWAGIVLGAVAVLVVHHLAASAEPASARRERAAVRRDLPLVVLLLGTALRGGAATGPAVRQVCAALPGSAASRLSAACDRLALGVDPERVWTGLAEDPDLAPLGRALARAHRSGAPVAGAVERLADDLASAAHTEVTDRARAVGVRAAVPLGVCLLPSFLLLGIVPLVVTLLSGLHL